MDNISRRKADRHDTELTDLWENRAPTTKERPIDRQQTIYCKESRTKPSIRNRLVLLSHMNSFFKEIYCNFNKYLDPFAKQADAT